jgi:FixJ family two-component response regulator
MNAKEKDSKSPMVSIVDDDASVRSSTRRLLRSSGLRAEAFESAEDFLKSSQLGQTACLLLDVRMAGVDGLELQRRLAEIGQRIPIIFLSAQASQEEESRALRAGAADFLRKPVSKDVLLRALHAVLNSAANDPSKDL